MLVSGSKTRKAERPLWVEFSLQFDARRVTTIGASETSRLELGDVGNEVFGQPFIGIRWEQALAGLMVPWHSA
jgi:hypothetical protein